jgi:hypothetical protein
MDGQEPPNRVYPAEHQQPTRGHLGIVPCKAEGTRDLPIRQRAERAVGAATCVPHHLPESFKLERVEICPLGAADTQAGPVHCAPVYLVGEHFVSVISQAARLPVPSQCSSHLPPEEVLACIWLFAGLPRSTRVRRFRRASAPRTRYR